MSLITATDFISLPLAVRAVTIIAVALASVWLLSRRQSSKTRSGGCSDGADRLPVAPANILECCLGIIGPSAFSFVKDMADATGSFIYRLRIPIPGGIVIIGDPIVQRQILLDIESEKPYLYSIFFTNGGYPNIFNRKTTDHMWKVARKGAAPAFSSREVTRMNSVCQEHMKKWMKSTADQGLVFDPSDEMLRLTFFILLESTMEYLPTAEEFTTFMENYEITHSDLIRFIPLTRRSLRARQQCRSYVQHILDVYRSNPNKSTHDTLIKLVEENPAFEGNDKMKTAELFTIMVAGFDTTGYTLSSTLFLLAQHPEVVKKARDSLGLSVQMNDTIRHILAESNRLYPVIPMGGARFVPRDVTAFDKKSQRKYVIPKGSNCVVPQYLANRNPAIYGDDANDFRPERWESATQEMKDALLMFSLGKRNCIGQSLALAELHSVLPQLIKDYNFELIEPGHLDCLLTLRIHGAKIKLSKVL